MFNASGMLIRQDIRQLRQDGPVGVEAEQLSFVKQPNHPEAEILRGDKRAIFTASSKEQPAADYLIERAEPRVESAALRSPSGAFANCT